MRSEEEEVKEEVKVCTFQYGSATQAHTIMYILSYIYMLFYFIFHFFCYGLWAQRRRRRRRRCCGGWWW